MTPRATPAASTAATPNPELTGRRLVELVVVTAKHCLVSRRDYQQIPAGEPALDELVAAGTILPPSLDRDVADHLVRRGLAARVLVRL